MCYVACATQSPVVVIGAVSRTGLKRQSKPSTQLGDLLGQEVRHCARDPASSHLSPISHVLSIQMYNCIIH